MTTSSTFPLSVQLGEALCVGHGAVQDVCSVHVGSVNSALILRKRRMAGSGSCKAHTWSEAEACDVVLW